MIAYIPIPPFVGNNIFLHYHYFQILWNQYNNFSVFNISYSNYCYSFSLYFPNIFCLYYVLFSVRKMLTTLSFFFLLYILGTYFISLVLLLKFPFFFFNVEVPQGLKVLFRNAWLINEPIYFWRTMTTCHKYPIFCMSSTMKKKRLGMYQHESWFIWVLFFLPKFNY